MVCWPATLPAAVVCKGLNDVSPHSQGINRRLMVRGLALGTPISFLPFLDVSARFQSSGQQNTDEKPENPRVAASNSVLGGRLQPALLRTDIRLDIVTADWYPRGTVGH